jgi:hypothetical protein
VLYSIPVPQLYVLYSVLYSSASAVCSIQHRYGSTKILPASSTRNGPLFQHPRLTSNSPVSVYGIKTKQINYKAIWLHRLVDCTTGREKFYYYIYIYRVGSGAVYHTSDGTGRGETPYEYIQEWQFLPTASGFMAHADGFTWLLKKTRMMGWTSSMMERLQGGRKGKQPIGLKRYIYIYTHTHTHIGGG